MNWFLRMLLLLATSWCGAAELRLVMEDGGLLLNESKKTNEAGETWSGTRLSYLVSGGALERKDGAGVGGPGGQGEGRAVWCDLAGLERGGFEDEGWDVDGGARIGGVDECGDETGCGGVFEGAGG